MQIKFEGLVTKSEFEKITKLQYDRALKPAKIICLSIIAIRITFFLVTISCRTTLPKLSSIIAELPFWVFLTFPWWVTVFNRRNKYDDPLNPFKQPVSGYFSDETYSLVTFLSTTINRWEGVTKYWNNQDFLFLYYRGIYLTPFSRSLFSSQEDWNEIIAFLQNRYPKKKRFGN
jgi:hypothetical protein